MRGSDRVVRQATPADRDLLVAMMAEFYAEAGYPVDRERAMRVFGDLLEDDRLGHAWILGADDEPAGYVAVTFGYSIEYGGRDAFLDDLYLRPAFRGRGLGRMAVQVAREYCESRAVRAMHLEVDRANATAQRLYRSAGFADPDRQLLTLRLRAPLHED